MAAATEMYKYWNYRVVSKEIVDFFGNKELSFGIHEVYYDAEDKPTAISEEPVYPSGSTIQEFQSDIAQYSLAATKPVLSYENDFPHNKN